NGDVALLAEMMMKTRIKSVPVLDGSAVVGIVSRRDLIAILARGDARIRDDVLAAISDYGMDDSTWDVSVREGVVELRGEADELARRVADVLARTVPGVTRVSIHTCSPPVSERAEATIHGRRVVSAAPGHWAERRRRRRLGPDAERSPG